MPQFGDDIFLGPAYAGGPDQALGNPSYMPNGIGPMGRVYVFDVVPVALNLVGLATAQAVAAAGNLTLTAGTGVTTSVDATGVTRYVLDTPRCVDFLSSDAADTTQTVLVSGYDMYGQPMTQLITLNGTSRVSTTKAFKSVVSAYVSALTAGNISMGFTDRLGLPVRVPNAVYVVGVNWNSTLARDAGTFTAAVATSPATTTTGDVRGTYLLSSAADGAKRLVMTIACPALACGPNATRVGAFGVTQV